MSNEVILNLGSSTSDLQRVTNGSEGAVLKIVNNVPTWVVPTPLDQATTGLLTGGVITINSGDNQTFDVSAGTGIIVDWTDPAAPVRYEVSWTAFTAESIPDLATGVFTTVRINNVGGIVKSSGTLLTPEQKRTNILLQSLVHISGTQIDSVTGSSTPAYDKTEGVLDYIASAGPITNGNDYSANGVNLQINKSSGTTTLPFINRVNDTMNPTLITNALQSPVNPITRTYQDGSSGFTFVSGNTVIDPSFYDDGTGTLDAVGVNNWTIQRIFFFGVNGATTIVYGQTVYNSLGNAQTALANKTDIINLSPLLTISGFLSMYLIVKNGASDLSDVGDAIFIDAED